MNLIGLILTSLYVFLLLFITTIFFKKQSEVSRKIIHMGACNCFFAVIFLFDNVYSAAILPFLFIIINFISYKKDIFKVMERDDKKSLGTIYYAISLFVLTILSFNYFDTMLYSSIGVFIMGYADAMASIIGTKYKSKKFKVFGNTKTFFGTITMFIASLIICFITTYFYHCFSLTSSFILAFLAMLIEFFSPYGLDNLTVPLLMAFIASFIL